MPAHDRAPKESHSPRYKQHEGLTVTSLVTLGGPIPVTVGTFIRAFVASQNLRRDESTRSQK